jgi:hypothetical protein
MTTGNISTVGATAAANRQATSIQADPTQTMTKAHQQHHRADGPSDKTGSNSSSTSLVDLLA